VTERVRVDPETLDADDGAAVALSDEITHHLRVLRIEAGETVVLFDGLGAERDAVISAVNRREMVLVVRGPKREGARADAAEVTWLQGYTKGDKLDLIVRQATELGAAVIRPVYTARSVPRERDGKGAARLLRWARIAEEAARQSGRADVPEVLAPASLDDALAALSPAPSLRVVAWERSDRSLLDVVAAAPEGPSVVLVGPEGGLDDDEVQRCVRAGFAHVSLGPRVLRAETVAPALLAVLSALRGDLRNPPMDARRR
jgi:16S rRNA (uracil1498-N3)-methyltransferase